MAKKAYAIPIIYLNSYTQKLFLLTLSFYANFSWNGSSNARLIACCHLTKIQKKIITTPVSINWLKTVNYTFKHTWDICCTTLALNWWLSLTVLVIITETAHLCLKMFLLSRITENSTCIKKQIQESYLFKGTPRKSQQE